MSRRSVASPTPLSLVKRRRPQQHPHGAPRDHNKAACKVSLERIVGLTCVTNNGLTVSPGTGCIAYPAGCVAVLYLPKKNRQLHILNTSKKPISCLCLSPDGKYLAIGEYGHQPSVQVWNVAGSPNHIAELKAHKHGIECMAFSPSMKYMVSVGYQHDMHIHVWNWRAGRSVATNKITSKVYGLAFSEDGKYFVTAGNRRVRFWNMHFSSTGKDEKQTTPLKGRSAILGNLQDNCFMAVECGRGSIAPFTYVLTRSGILCKFDQNRALDMFVTVQASACRCLSLSESWIVCGCGEGVVRLFDPCTLDYLLTMPLPHPLGVNVALSMDTNQPHQEEGGMFPDTVAMAMDNTNKRLSVVYSDHSLYVWDVRNLRQIRKLHSFLHHNACIWDLCLYPSLAEPGALPSSCLVTCSTDNTIRFWTLYPGSVPSQHGGPSFVKNMYSKELMRIIYTSPDLSSLNDTSKYPGDASAVADTQRGVRCAKFHPKGHQLATGDRAGNIRVYDMQFMDVVFEVEAHIAEILCIEYSPEHEGLRFMASASRDRLIHVFTVTDHYQHIQTIDDHSASITAIRFSVRNGLQLLSCGADKSIMFRTLEKTPSHQFHRTSHIASKASIYDMDIDVVDKHMATAGQDRMLRVYQLSTGKQKAVIKASTGDEGSLIKVAMDPSGLYVATSSSDKTVSLFDFYSGECLAKLYGHSEIVTQVKFSADCKFLYSISADGCIFIWRLSGDLTQTMHDRLAEIGTPVPPSLELTPIKAPLASVRRDTYSVAKAADIGTPPPRQTDSTEEADMQFRLSVGQLPGWAQRQVHARPSIAQSFSTSAMEKVGAEKVGAEKVGGEKVGGEGVQEAEVEGRWAQRISDKESLQFASQNVTDSGTESPGGAGLTRSRAYSAPDITIIDLTDSPERVVGAEEERKTEEEVFYPPLTTDIDPSVFKVTTPEKMAKRGRLIADSVQEEEEDEDEEDSGSSGSNNPSPVSAEDFLKTNFESLSADQADAFFSHPSPDPHDPRLSISARFFSQSTNKSLRSPWSEHVAASRKNWWSSPELLAGTKPTEPVEPVEKTGPVGQSGGRGEGGVAVEGDGGDVGGEGGVAVEGDGGDVGGEGGAAVKGEGGDMGNVGGEGGAVMEEERGAGVKEKSDVETSTESVSSSSSGEAGDKLTKRSPAIQVEIDKTKKRLEELGYAIPDKTPAVTAPPESPPPLPHSSQPPQSPPPLPHSSHISQSSQRRVKVKSKRLRSHSTPDPTASKTEPSPEEPLTDPPAGRETAGGTMHDDSPCHSPEPTLLSRASLCVAGLTEGFRNLVALHEQAMEGLAESQGGGGGVREGGGEGGAGGGGEGGARGGGGGMGDCEETVCAIATAVNSLKSQSVSLANRHRKRWREVAQRCRGGGKREAAVSGTSRDSMEGDTGGNVETEEAGVVAGGGSREMQREKTAVQEEGTTHTLGESAVGATGMEKEVEEGVRRGAGERLVDPAVLQLLNRYSEQLVELVRERTLHLPAD